MNPPCVTLIATLRSARSLPEVRQRALRAPATCFDRFRAQYDCHHPYAALGDRTPAEHYGPGTRPYSSRLEALEDPGHFEVRRIGANGCIKRRGRFPFTGTGVGGR